MSRLKKYNFIPEHQLSTEDENDSSGFTVNINSNATLYINGFDAKMYDLDGAIVRFYGDVVTKSISWKVIKGGNLDTLKNLRQLKTNPHNNAMVVSISTLLEKIGVTKDMLPLKKVPVTEYRDTMVDEVFQVVDIGKYLKDNNKNNGKENNKED